MLDEVGGISKLLYEYGPYIVILAVVLVLFLMIIVYILNVNKKTIENERQMNNKLVTSLLNDYFAQNSKVLVKEDKSYDEKHIVDIYMKLNKSLKNVCELTLKKTGSNRTAIYVFHNGSHASHGLPFFKMSCISEKVTKDSNTNIKMSEHSAMPLNLFDSIVSGLYNNAEYRITLEKDNDPSDIIFLKGTKIKDCFFIPIFDDDDNMMGFIFNGYNTINPNKDIEKEKEYLSELATMAKPVIEFSRLQEYQSNEEE